MSYFCLTMTPAIPGAIPDDSFYPLIHSQEKNVMFSFLLSLKFGAPRYKLIPIRGPIKGGMNVECQVQISECRMSTYFGPQCRTSD